MIKFKLIGTCVLFLLLMVTQARAEIVSYQKTGDGVSFTLDKGMMFIRIVANDLIEVKYTNLAAMPEKKSLVVLNSPSFKKSFTVSDTKDAVIITTGKLKIRVDRATNAIRYLDLNGSEILSEANEKNKVMRDTIIAGIPTFSCTTSFTSPATEGLYGLGCHPLDTLSINYKGRNQNMAIKYLTGAIPVMMSTRGYGLLWDNYSESNFFGSENNNTQYTYISESGKLVDYYFFYGPSFDHIVNQYRNLTGKAPMYPKWAFGLFQSQDRYKRQTEIDSVRDTYRNNHIPVDVIVQDWFYWFPLPIGSHVFEPIAYPDVKKMVAGLHNANIHGMISIWPCFGQHTPNYDALKKAGNLTSVTWDNFFVKTRDTYYDAHSPAAREMYWDQARDSLIKKYDWDAWWVDQCEPDTEDPNDRKRANFFTGKGIDYFNTYALMHTEGLYHKWRRDIPNKRIFLLVRQSFAGEQRNAATLWSSDIQSTFSAYKAQVAQAINTCSSGIPYWTSDIGGYILYSAPQGTPDWSQPEKRELFTRWFQFGTFCPIFRIHGKGERALFSKNWDESTRAVLMKFDNLRYRLLPYIYSLSAKVTNDNYTILRSLAFDFRNDEKVYNIPDQYMFGPAFLVNPVTEQLYTSANTKQKTRSLYLPQAKWYDFWTGELIEGGKTIIAQAPIDILPLYVKAGSIVPMGEEMEYATQKPASNIELRIYPGANGEFNLYEDENNNYNYEKGKFATITFKWNDASQTLSVSDVKGSFPGMLQSRTFNVVVVKNGNGTGETPSTKFEKTIHYNGKAVSVGLKGTKP